MTLDWNDNGPVYHFSYEESPSEAVLNAIGWLTDRDLTELEPLFSVIDPEALDELESSGSDRDLAVEFDYEGCAVEIVENGDLYVSPSVDSDYAPLKSANSVLLLDETAGSDSDSSGAVQTLPIAIEEADTMVITYSAEAVLDWRDAVSPAARARPTSDRILVAGEFTRSSATQSTTVADPASTVQVESLTDPTDLTALGMEITESLTQWGERNRPTVLCFDSLTHLLEHVSLRQAYEFLHILLRQLRIADVGGYFYLDPHRQDEQSRRTLESLFDTVATRRSDAQWVIGAP